jgi:thiosulfate/3-mercaptopyruvate sulfurtransferase
MAQAYAHPEALVEARWLAGHRADPGLRIVQVDASAEPYSSGHIPGAVLWVRDRDLEDPVRADIPSEGQFQALMARSGISPQTTVMLYGEGSNRQATWAFWLLKLYRHQKVQLLNGGLRAWQQAGLPLSTDLPAVRATSYPATQPDPSLRALHSSVQAALGKPSVALVDVRTPEEYRGQDNPEHPQAGLRRLGRIPGAVHLPWELALNPDGTFKSREELEQLYKSKGVTPAREAVTYCRLGVRASHTWFVLKELLGYPAVRLYDGSWSEWGNLVGVPIER